MHFEDYNYNAFNKYILIDPNREISEFDENEEDDLDAEKDGKLGFSAPPVGRDGMAAEDARPHLTDNVLDQSVHESYKHNQMDVETEAERDIAYQNNL